MLRARLLVGSFLILLVSSAFAVDFLVDQPWMLTATVAVLAGVGAYELCAMAHRAGRRPFRAIAVAGTVALVAVSHGVPGSDAVGLRGELIGLVLVALLGAMLIAQRLRGSLEGALDNCGSTLMAVVYVGFLMSFLTRIRLLQGVGLAGVVLVVFAAKTGDIAAYFVGKSIGRRKLAPMVSPNKTVAGAVAGLAVSIAVGTAVAMASGILPLPQAMAVSGMIGVLAQLGDLSESVLKRDLNAKDASASVPGFGGVLDILDSFLFAAPAAYFVFWCLAA